MGADKPIRRTHLPSPEVPQWELTTRDANDPDMKFPPIHDLRPPFDP
jgi:hypothetical protein